ncbi:helix-turn-helix domain-containing protein [Hirschia baltica]|uniref:Transcriptional regulator, XRE family n=1 Tax=Hirschia baltica (strain ATCC 49814 / DSM 5838 / IFAM 1418) TaxID=582402 RepID=C6XRL5_HIRBI|nr:XRE family transcriptional regulator [Hirschia baltica]ACT60625.1 transcriptional regulator, XRE family [Hirschia baltica ATCC 49814]
MRNAATIPDNSPSFTDADLAQRLKELRAEQNWSLDQLAEISGISRGTLFRLEKGEVSPTAHVLGKLCPAYGLTMSRLMAMVETQFSALIPRGEQKIWYDADYSFKRKSVSPPSTNLSGEVIECELIAGASISYDKPPRRGLEHHLIMQAGQLQVTVDNAKYSLKTGDCLRYQLTGSSHFKANSDATAQYILVII